MFIRNNESASRTYKAVSAGSSGKSATAAQNAPPRFECDLESAWNPREWCDVHTVIAVSGGADSVALLRAMAALKTLHHGKGEVVVAHLDHQLRDGSKEDAAWLRSLTSRLGVELEVGTVDVASEAVSRGEGVEEAGREARYRFLRETAEKRGARFVVTAHTRDDLAETVLHRIVRGTGLAGLAGIPSRRRLSESVSVIRPMLSITRSSVLEYLAALGQNYRTDETNDDIAYTRNRVRHNLLPELRECFNPEVDAALIRLASQASETQQALELLAGRLAAECVATVDESSIQIACAPLIAQPDVLVREVCRWAWRDVGWPMQAMGYCEWRLLSQLVAGQLQKANLPGNIRARREPDRLCLERTA